MRNELEYLAEIEHYILDPNSDKAAFEQKMQNDPELRQDVEAIRSLMDGIRKQGIQQEIVRANTNYRLTKTLKYLSITLVALVSLLAGVMFMYNMFGGGKDVQIRSTLPATNEVGGTEWTQADSVLPYLIYTISGDKDEVIETPEGLIFSIPKGSFRSKNGEPITGEFELEIKEAMNATDIMKAGLSTWSDDKLLETGGMFYINARKDGENLQIAKDANITASIPKLQNRNDMMLFDGVRVNPHWRLEGDQGTDSSGHYSNQAGQINWINPRKPISDIIAVPMDMLNFYPPNFEKTLAEAGYPNKAKVFKDSVYLSFSSIGNLPICIPTTIDTLESYITNGEKSIQIDTKNWDKYLKTVDSLGDSYSMVYFDQKFSDTNGEKLFKENCARCHNTGNQKLTGPGLKDVRSRWVSEDQLISWIRNSGAYLSTGDPYAIALYEKFNRTSMPSFPNLTKGDASAILDYIDDMNGAGGYGIRPSSVLAFWNKEFNKTILSTKEFEKRMQYIHRTCNEDILNCYTKNLDKPLYYCDSLAATKSYGDEQLRFQKYYSEGLGSPADMQKITSALLNVFAKKQRELDAAYNRTTGEWFRQQAKADAEAIKNAGKQIERNDNREEYNFDDEFNKNLADVKRQLGETQKPVFFRNVRQNYNTFHVATTGWKNVDAYVFEATENRVSMNYTDPQSGKTATLTYSELKLSISNISGFDISEAYLIPSGKMSFMRMKKQGNVYKESLNMLYQYHLVAVGFKGKEVFLYTKENITPGELTGINLSSSTAGEIDRFINRNASQRASDDLSYELKYLNFKVADTKRVAEKLKVEQLREVLMPVVFPCGVGNILTAADSSAAPMKSQ